MTRILIVEDNDMNLKLVKVLLEKQNYELDEARDGEQALDKIANNIYDLILMDVQIPKIDGLEVTRRARKMKGREKMPIVALTAYARKVDKENALEAGCTGYLSKPIDVKTFVSEVQSYLP